MKYRPYGKKVDFNVSVFGIGCMRLPKKKNEKGDMAPDQEFANKLIRRAIDNGINYFDSAHAYLNEQADAVLGEALSGGYREKVMVASKIPPRYVKNEDDFNRILDVQLEKLQSDYMDVLLCHSLNKESYQQALDVGMIDMMEKAKTKGKIRYLGFSFHDDYDLFKRIVDSHDWAMCNVQMNILDHDFQATTKGIEYAHNMGLAVCVMEPLRGGALASPPPAVERLYEQFPIKRSAVEWCFRDVYNMPGVSVVLSGLNALEQLEENLSIFNKAEINSMNDAEKDLTAQVRKAYESLMTVPCTGCAYCMPCPQGVNIPKIFSYLNSGSMLGDWDASKTRYQHRMDKEGANNCVECGACEQACPQSIPIIDKLKEAHALLAK